MGPPPTQSHVDVVSSCLPVVEHLLYFTCKVTPALLVPTVTINHSLLLILKTYFCKEKRTHIGSYYRRCLHISVTWGRWRDNGGYCSYMWFTRCKSEWTHDTGLALNMGNFYLARESPRGENCHILTVDVLPSLLGAESHTNQAGGVWGGGISPESAKSCWGQTVWLSLRYSRVHQHQSRHTHPQPPIRAAGFSSDKCTSEWQNHKREPGKQNKNKKETKVCTGRRWSTFCITVFFWYTEIDAQRKGTSRDKEDTSHNWQDCGHIPMISSNLSIRRLNTDSSIRLIYTWYFNFSLGAAMKLAYIPNIWGIKKITKKPGEIIRLFWLVS